MFQKKKKKMMINFDHRDDMSESLHTGDGGSGSGSKRGDEVDDGTSKAKKARKGGKNGCYIVSQVQGTKRQKGSILATFYYY
jgi:hypothetical protein